MTTRAVVGKDIGVVIIHSMGTQAIMAKFVDVHLRQTSDHLSMTRGANLANIGALQTLDLVRVIG